MLAAVIAASDGPDVFALDEVPEPSGGAILIDVTLAGVSLRDLEHRRGPHAPPVLGTDVVGRRRSDGRRVAALLPDGGGYAQVVAAPAGHVVEVPDEVGDEQALAVLEQGLTAWHCLHTVGRVDPGDVVLVATAGAGGAGHLEIQLARSAGARVIASVQDGTPTLILDGIGGRLFEQLRAVLAPFGRIVTYGEPLGSVPVAPLVTASTGVLGFDLRQVLADEELYRSSAARLFHLVERGVLTFPESPVYPLSAVGRAHTDLENRVVAGKPLIDVRHPF
ncbi:quinone oxidoreductase family protein [Actinoplanes couchii]|uniref:NADPH:quinone reductase n=1 Tax=Actinoplanes couchii TaxID=403638 RepID=A0ABQ3X3S0_9ACTN|nr:zinc-binding dehydrogenase [Actinoplanes couchii]MDR6322815.1 NADPH2:quinone reductase [Actinoplanes couchii]GID53055.1 NADPH:quinone reductase [Actinoplanes couchii]